MKIILTFLTIALFSFGANAGLFHSTPVGKKGDVILEFYSTYLNEWVQVSINIWLLKGC